MSIGTSDKCKLLEELGAVIDTKGVSTVTICIVVKEITFSSTTSPCGGHIKIQRSETNWIKIETDEEWCGWPTHSPNFGHILRIVEGSRETPMFLEDMIGNKEIVETLRNVVRILG